MSQRHLTVQDREIIAIEHAKGLSQHQIAAVIGFSQATVSRELARNHVGGCYRALSAQELTEDRRRQALRLRPRKLQRPELLRFVQEGLRLRWSPEQIAGRWRRIRRPRRTKQVSYQTIYNWIWEKKAQGQQWHVCLRHRPKRGRRRKASGTDLRGKIPNRVPMEHRPEVVASKARMGDWESDSLIGGHYSGLIATHVERCSQYLVMAQVGKRDWRLYNRATEAAFARHDSRLPLPRHTTTADNGQEFWGHEALGKSLGLQVYFAPPHQPWQRGLNEQVNGLIRQFLPKGSDLTAVSQKRLEQVEELLNNRPRKTLRYQTPVEVLRKHLYASRI